MLYPIIHKPYLDIIYNTLYCIKYMYGSKRYGWMSYHHQIADVMMDVNLRYGGINTHNIEIYNNDFIIIMKLIYPNWAGTYNFNRSNYAWNKVKMPGGYEQRNLNPNGISYEVEYLGSLDEIASAATLISLSE